MNDDLIARPQISKQAFSGKNWSREQLKLAFVLYCQTPFGKLHGRNPRIIELAKLIGRSPGALAMKLSNFASLDPSITATGRRGLSGASALDRDVWHEFHADWERLIGECEDIRQGLMQQLGLKPVQPQAVDDDYTLSDYTGEMRKAIVQQRIKQDFFRRAVLASYRGRCCISGVSEPRLLVASHIVPWREDKANRLNPSNGLCLSAIHDKAFDNHLFSLTDDYGVVLSKGFELTSDMLLREIFWTVQNHKITLPERFLPDPVFVQRHREQMLIRG